MISIQHLQKSFGDNTVLKHIDLSVEKGRSCCYYRAIGIW